MRTIFNCTQHKATKEQLEAGVISPASSIEGEIKSLLTFNTIPSQKDMEDRAEKLACMAFNTGAKQAMLGGAPFFMSTLEKAMIKVGVQPIYAFSIRQSKEVDGVKTSVFNHVGFVCAEQT